VAAGRGVKQRVRDAVKHNRLVRMLYQRVRGLVGGQTRSTVRPIAGDGYGYEAAEVMRCLIEGKTESAMHPLDATLSVMQTMDEVRAQWKRRGCGPQLVPSRIGRCDGV
jgi:hypothetical protein